MENIQTFQLEAGDRKLGKAGQRPLCEHTGDLATWALGPKLPPKTLEPRCSYPVVWAKPRGNKRAGIEAVVSRSEGSAGFFGYDGLDLDGDRSHKKQREAYREPENCGFGIWNEGGSRVEERCQSMSQRINWLGRVTSINHAMCRGSSSESLKLL